MSIRIPKTLQAGQWLVEAKDNGHVILTLPIMDGSGDKLVADFLPDQATSLAYAIAQCAATARGGTPR